MDFELCWVSHGSDEYWETVSLRNRVLREPLGRSFSEEELEQERDQHHLSISVAGEVVGCLILVNQGDLGKMRQVAVLPEQQGTGYGSQLVWECERHAMKQGAQEIILHAREPVVGFYKRLGYTVEGDPFEEVGLPHRLMRKRL